MRLKFPHSIRSRLLFGFVLMALLSALGIALGSVVVGYLNGRQQARHRLTSVAQAKELQINVWVNSLQADLAAALNGDDIYEKDGAALSLILKVASSKDSHVRLAQVLQEQFKAIGVELTIEQLEEGVMAGQLAGGDYTIAIDDWLGADSSLMFGLFHSAMLGTLNRSQISDPDLDATLGAMMFASNSEDNETAAAQQYVVEQAIIIPFYTPLNYVALSNKVEGEIYSPILGILNVLDAYVVETE